MTRYIYNRIANAGNAHAYSVLLIKEVLATVCTIVYIDSFGVNQTETVAKGNVVRGSVSGVES